MGSIEISEKLFEVLKGNSISNLIREGTPEAVGLLEDVLRAQFVNEQKKERSQARRERQERQEQARWKRQEQAWQDQQDRLERQESECDPAEPATPVFLGYGGKHKIDAVKAIRHATGWTLKQSKEYVEGNLGLAISWDMAKILSDIGCDIQY